MTLMEKSLLGFIDLQQLRVTIQLMKFLDNLSFPMLIILAYFMAMAPFGAEPHLVEKWNMLMSGTLVKPLDIFDLLMHSTPIILLLLKSALFLKKPTDNDIDDKTD